MICGRSKMHSLKRRADATHQRRSRPSTGNGAQMVVSRWIAPCGVVLFVALMLADQRPAPVSAVLAVSVGLVAAWWISPLHRGKGPSHAEAASSARTGAVI